MNEQSPVRRPLIANALNKTRHVFVNDLTLEMLIGVYEHEKVERQPVIISLDLTVRDTGGPINDEIHGVVCYEKVVNRVRDICASGHVNLVETLAERVAESCLNDTRVEAVRVRIEKPNAIPDCRSVGIEIERLQART
ncbi:MAG: dihydroneopterin aldolase [Rhizobiales bacterium]|nr:dihydroneopterin aldolase [Hyphomicrobiales bacterium]